MASEIEVESLRRPDWRTTSRSMNAQNWRVKAEPTEDVGQVTEGLDNLSVQSNSGPRTGTSWGRNGTPKRENREDRPVAEAITEGRRLYIGNLQYFAKKTDIEDLFKEFHV